MAARGDIRWSINPYAVQPARGPTTTQSNPCTSGLQTSHLPPATCHLPASHNSLKKIPVHYLINHGSCDQGPQRSRTPSSPNHRSPPPPSVLTLCPFKVHAQPVERPCRGPSSGLWTLYSILTASNAWSVSLSSPSTVTPLDHSSNCPGLR